MNFSVLACSGPGAMRLIADNILYAQQHAAVVAGLAMLSIVLWLILGRFKAIPLCLGVLFVVHPAWTVSAIQGDCGHLKANAATFITAFASVCVAFQCMFWIWTVFRRHALKSVASSHQ